MDPRVFGKFPTLLLFSVRKHVINMTSRLVNLTRRRQCCRIHAALICVVSALTYHVRHFANVFNITANLVLPYLATALITMFSQQCVGWRHANQSTAHSWKHRFDTRTRAWVRFICSRGAARVVNCGRVHPNQHHRRDARGNNKPVNAIQRESTYEVFSLRATATC